MCATHLLMPGEAVDEVEGGLVGELFRALVDLIIDVPREPQRSKTPITLFALASSPSGPDKRTSQAYLPAS
jgi:hypothetical protein